MAQPVFSRKKTTTDAKDRVRGGQEFSAVQDDQAHETLSRILRELAIANQHWQLTTDHEITADDIEDIQDL